MLNTSLMTLASFSEACDFLVTGFSGQLSGSRNHAGPLHQSSVLVTRPPLLAISAGLSRVGTYLHLTSGCSLIFLCAVRNKLVVLTVS